MGILDRSIEYIKNKYSSVDINYEDNYIIFEGIFYLEGGYKDFVMQRAPYLRLVMPKDYPKTLPSVIDIENKIDYDHKFEDNNLCLATPLDMFIRLHSSNSIEDYIEYFLIPYFISYEYWLKSGRTKDIYGDRSHGVDGILESFADFFNVDSNNKKLIYSLLLWAGKKKKFQRIFPKNIQQDIIKKYNTKIIFLRKMGIVELKKILIILKI